MISKKSFDNLGTLCKMVIKNISQIAKQPIESNGIYKNSGLGIGIGSSIDGSKTKNNFRFQESGFVSFIHVIEKDEYAIVHFSAFKGDQQKERTGSLAVRNNLLGRF